MNHQRAIEAAVIAFRDWDRPWTFHATVAAALEADARNEFEQFWQYALRQEHWSGRDLDACARATANALMEQFPHFRRDTLGAIARAASFQWR